MCAFHGTKWCASELKIQKFRSFNIEGLGKFREVVLTRGVPINAIRVRFEEGWSYFLVWKRLGKRKISCFFSGSSVMMNLFLKIYEKLWKEATRIAPGLF